MEQNGHFTMNNGQIVNVQDAEVVPFEVPVLDTHAEYVSDAQDALDAKDAALKAMMAELEAARAENARLKAQQERQQTLTLKISEKGGISVYGLGRFPVTLYAEQWEKIGKLIPTLAQFAKANAQELRRRNLAAKAAKAESK